MNTLKSMPISVFVFATLLFYGFWNANIVRAQGGSGKTSTTKTKTKTTKTTSTSTTRTNRTTNTQTRRNVVSKVADWEMDNLVGTWVGTFSDQYTILEIERVGGSTFYGTLIQGEDEVSFTGFVDKNTRKVTITETQVLKVREGGDWTLGIDNGTLLAGGNKMSGSGKDGVNPVYYWSFTKSN
ncbi:hypothetical protein BH10ACI1_BH10ACI1_29400 [soil metagenome]